MNFNHAANLNKLAARLQFRNRKLYKGNLK